MKLDKIVCHNCLDTVAFKTAFKRYIHRDLCPRLSVKGFIGYRCESGK